MFDAEHCATNLAEFGLETVPWIPGRGTGSDHVAIGGGKARPLLRIAEVKPFVEKFPNGNLVILNGLDGQSPRVKCQGVIRPLVEKDHKVADGVVILRQVQALANIQVKAALTPAALSDEALKAELARRGLA